MKSCNSQKKMKLKYISPVELIIKWYPILGKFSIFIVVLIYGFKSLFVKNSSGVVGWCGVSALRLTGKEYVNGFRVVNLEKGMDKPLLVSDEKNKIDEDIYPLV